MTDVAQNNEETAAVRGRPFRKGQSGNPGGRPKAVAEVREAARQHTAQAIGALVKNLSDKNGHVRNAAAQILLDRGWGKPSQAYTGEGGEGPVVVTWLPPQS